MKIRRIIQSELSPKLKNMKIWRIIQSECIPKTKHMTIRSLGPINNISNKEDSLTEVGVCAPSWLKYVE